MAGSLSWFPDWTLKMPILPIPQSLAHFFDPSGIFGNGISPTFLWSHLHSLVRHQVAEAHHDFFLSIQHTWLSTWLTFCSATQISPSGPRASGSWFDFEPWVLRSTSQIHPGAFPMCPVFFWGSRWTPCSFLSLGDLGVFPSRRPRYRELKLSCARHSVFHISLRHLARIVEFLSSSSIQPILPYFPYSNVPDNV